MTVLSNGGDTSLGGAFDESSHLPDFPQIFETRFFEPTGRLSFYAMTLPSRSLDEDLVLDPEEIRRVLRVRTIALVTTWTAPKLFSMYITAVVTETEDEFARKGAELALRLRPSELLRYERIARRVLDEPLIPFEHSPLKAERLSDLIGELKEAGVPAAWAGFVALTDQSPLFLLLLPAGIILFKAAKGIGSGLERGLEERVYSLISRRKRTAKRRKSASTQTDGAN